LAAVPSIGRAAHVEHPASPGAHATSELYERFSAQIFGYCLHQLGSREEAEDAVQTTFMNAFRGLQRGIVPQVESAWLFKIAHNVCLSRRRSTWRRGRVEAPNNLEVLKEVVPARDERIADELIRLQDVLEEMPENQRRAILLREWQGLSYREISEELDVSQSAVETLIFRARRGLAAGLEEAPVKRGWRGTVHYGFDAGAVLAALKTLLTGGVASKAAATAVAVATSAAAVSGSQYYIEQHERHVNPAPTYSAPIARAPKDSALITRALKHSTVARSKHATRAVIAPTRARAVVRAKPRAAPPSSTTAPPFAATGVHAAAQLAPEPASERGLNAADPPVLDSSAAPLQQADLSEGRAGLGPPAAPPAGDRGKAAVPGQQDKGQPDKAENGHGNGHS